MLLGFGLASITPSSLPPLQDGKFDMEKMKEGAAIWLLMHDRPFTLIEDKGFNLFCKRGMSEWTFISQSTVRKNCFMVYKMEKIRMKNALNSVEKICITIDLWKSKNQNIEYMVITGQWIDSSWKLNKRVLNFVQLPPHHGKIQITDVVLRCLSEWEIKNKIFSVSVDNARANDVAISIMRDSFTRTSRLCDGKLFHVGCTTHILNLIAHDGLSEIKNIISIIQENVDFIRCTDGRMIVFAEVAKQLKLPNRKLIDDCKTRWNSTYEMLNAKLTFKEVFPRFKVREPTYDHCPTNDDWEKLEKVISILWVFFDAAKIIFGSDYPTSNLFLSEVFEVKLLLDDMALDDEKFIQDMAAKMKLKFYKYWGESNMLMAIGAVLDSRVKWKPIEYYYGHFFSKEDAATRINDI